MTDRALHRKAVVLMVCVPVLWSMAGIFTRQLEVARSFEVTFWRSLFAALFVALALVFKRQSVAISKIRRMGWLGLLSGVLWASMFSCFMLALTMTTVANTLIVDSVSPLLTVFFAWIFLKQKATPRTWIAIVLAFIGMVWMFSGGMSKLGRIHLAGMAVAMMVPFAAAANFIILKKAGQEHEMTHAVFLGGALSALLMLPLAWPFQASFHDIALMALLGVFQLGLPCMLLIKASKNLSATEISLLSLLEILLGPIWVWLGVGEIPSSSTLVGGSIVLLGLILHELAPIPQYRDKQTASISINDPGR